MRTWPLAIAVLVACRGGAPGGSAASGVASDDARPAIDPAWAGTCLDALERASSAAPRERIAIALAGCRPCGVDWKDALTSTVASQVVAVVDACELGCARTARSDFFAAISALEDDQRATGPWRALGGSCAAALGAGGGDGRYAGGTWFALHQIGRRLVDAPLGDRDRARWRSLQASLWFPLPVVSQVGTQFVVPTATAVTEPPSVHVTLTGDAITTGALPRAIFDDRGLALAPSPGAPWPGDAITADALAASLDARAAKDVLVIAPTGLDASRVLAIVAQLGDRRAALAVTRGDGAMAAAQVAFVHGPLARGLAIDAGASRACAASATGITGCVELPPDAGARRALLAELTASHPRIAIAVMPMPIAAPAGRRAPPPPSIDAAAIAARLDELAGLGVTEVIAAELPGPWPTTTTAVLRAQLGEGASP